MKNINKKNKNNTNKKNNKLNKGEMTMKNTNINNKKDFMRKAHEITRNIKAKYPDTNYHAQLGLVMKELHRIKKEEAAQLPQNEVTKKEEVANKPLQSAVKNINYGDHKISIKYSLNKDRSLLSGVVLNRTTQQRFRFYWRKGYDLPMVKVEGVVEVNLNKARHFVASLFKSGWGQNTPFGAKTRRNNNIRPKGVPSSQSEVGEETSPNATSKRRKVTLVSSKKEQAEKPVQSNVVNSKTGEASSPEKTNVRRKMTLVSSKKRA